MTYVSRTGPYVPNLGNFTTAAELASTKPANLYNPGTTAYTADQGLMITDGTIWDTAGAIPGEVELKAATYAIARTLSGTATGDRLQVLGRTTQSDGGQGLFTWVAGGSTTVDDGYVLQATGGTWQRQDPSPTTGETLLNAVWFNIKPANSDVTNDAGFAKLKAQMQTSATTTWRVFFPPGAYTYTNNRWLFGVQKVIIEAYDCTFQCTSANANFGNGIPLFNGDPFDDSGDVAWPHSTYANGYLFNTATAGAISITTTTAADAGNFTPGMRVLLSGYDQQQAGYPPNLRYFDYKTVLTAVAGTGVVTFTDPLQFAYDSRWADTTYPDGTQLAHGAPRILSVERANYKRAQLIWIKGATFLRNPTTTTSSTLQLTGDLLIYEDTTAPAYNVAETTVQIMRRCKGISVGSGDQSAADKLVDRLIVEDSLFDVSNSGAAAPFVDCVGTNSLALIRSKFFGSVKTIAPRSLFVDDCDIIPLAADSFGINTPSTNPIRAVSIGNTRIYNTGGLNNGFANAASPGKSLTVGTVVGTDIRITFDATGKAVMNSIEYGMTLTNTVTGNTGIITAIYYETGSPGTLRIAGTWSAPTAADVFNYYDVMQASETGVNVIIGTQVPFWRSPPGPSNTSGLTLSGTPTIKDGLLFSAPSQILTANRISFTNASYGLQISSNNGGANIGYLSGSSLNMSNGSTLQADTLNANSAALAVSQGTKTVNIGTGTTSGQVTIGGGSNTVVIGSPVNINNLLWSKTAPTISSGFGTSPSISQNNGTASFSINVGTGGVASSGVIGLPTAAHAWAGCVADVTNPTANNTVITASTTNSVTVTNYSRTTGVAAAWPASDILQISLFAN